MHAHSPNISLVHNAWLHGDQLSDAYPHSGAYEHLISPLVIFYVCLALIHVVHCLFTVLQWDNSQYITI